jgi:hypothetical protein
MLMERLSIDKFAEGFVTECRVLGVDPTAVVKLAQAKPVTKPETKPEIVPKEDPRAKRPKVMPRPDPEQVMNTRLPGHGETPRFNPITPGAAAAISPVAQLANLGGTGADTQFTGSSADPKSEMRQRANAYRAREGLAPLTAPLARRTGAFQFGREVNALTPGFAAANEQDLAAERIRVERKQMADQGVNIKPWGQLDIAQKGSQNLRGFLNSILPVEQWSRLSGERGISSQVMDYFDSEGKAERDNKAEQATLKTEQVEADKDVEWAKGRTKVQQKKQQIAHANATVKWHRERDAMVAGGADKLQMRAWVKKYPRPKKPTHQWAAPEGGIDYGTGHIRRTPLTDSAAWLSNRQSDENPY